jgi:hypothetical protein
MARKTVPIVKEEPDPTTLARDRVIKEEPHGTPSSTGSAMPDDHAEPNSSAPTTPPNSSTIQPTTDKRDPETPTKRPSTAADPTSTPSSAKKQITVYPPIDDPVEAIRKYHLDKDDYSLRHYIENSQGQPKPTEVFRTRFTIGLPGFADKAGNTHVVFTGILSKHDLNLSPIGTNKWSEKRFLTVNYPNSDLHEELVGSALRQLDNKLQNLSFLGTTTYLHLPPKQAVLNP